MSDEPTSMLPVAYNYKYVTYGVGGERERIVCRGCDEIIADIIDISATTDAAGTVTIRQAFKFLSNYTKVIMLLTNGVKIESAMCKGCAKWLGRDELNMLYDSEIKAIQYDGEVHSADVSSVVAQLQTQKVVRRIG